MNATLEERLKELINEAEQLGAPAVHTVLNLLLASHSNGNHHKFAKYCCDFSSAGTVELKTRTSDSAPKPVIDEFDDDSWNWNVGKYSH